MKKEEPRPEWDPTPETPFERALTGDLECDSCDYGPCILKANKKAEEALGMPSVCPYGQTPMYADFTALYNIKYKKKGGSHGPM